MTFIKLDFRLVEVSYALYALEDQLSLIEQQLEEIKNRESAELNAFLRSITPDDPEGEYRSQAFSERNEFVYPRFFRGSLLISLYAVYESAVTEIARLIQKKKGLKISLDDIKGDFLERSKKYYEHVLDFPVCTTNPTWEQIRKLSVIRNAFAHANGRIEMLRGSVREELEKWSRKGTGIKCDISHLSVDASFVSTTLKCVQSSLEDLIERYKTLDTNNHLGAFRD